MFLYSIIGYGALSLGERNKSIECSEKAKSLLNIFEKNSVETVAGILLLRILFVSQGTWEVAQHLTLLAFSMLEILKNEEYKSQLFLSLKTIVDRSKIEIEYAHFKE